MKELGLAKTSPMLPLPYIDLKINYFFAIPLFWPIYFFATLAYFYNYFFAIFKILNVIP